MPNTKVLVGFILLLCFTGSLVYADVVTLNPTDDIAIANDRAVTESIGAKNDGVSDTLTITNFKC